MAQLLHRLATKREPGQINRKFRTHHRGIVTKLAQGPQQRLIDAHIQ